MNQNFLAYYQQELKFFRDSAKEFAAAYPQVAKRLGLSAPEIEDPYVERLIEAVSFLTARINLKVDAEYPNFLQHIFGVIQPEFTQPIPTAGIVEMTPTVTTLLPKYTALTTYAKRKADPVCTFSTCHDQLLLPLQLGKVRYFHANKGVIQTNFFKQPYQSQLSFSLIVPSQFSFNNVDLNQLMFFLQSDDLYSNSELLYLLKKRCIGLQVSIDHQQWQQEIKPNIVLCGFDEYLSIHNDRNQAHLKHLLEYSILPEKYLFFRIANLADVLSASSLQAVLQDNAEGNGMGSSVKITFNLLFDEYASNLETSLSEDALSIHSVLITNVFRKRTRMMIDTHKNEQHIVLDKLRPQDYEVVRVTDVEGFSNTNHSIKQFEPLYRLSHHNADLDPKHYGFFSTTHKKTTGAKAGAYQGNECYIMLNNQLKHVMEDDLTQLSIGVWSSNRSLPSDISWTLDQDLHVTEDGFKVSRIKRQTSFTQPLDIPTETVCVWRLMNLLSANFVPIDLQDSQALTRQIKNNLLTIYDISKNEAFRAQINAITHIAAQRTHQIQRVHNRLAPINGLQFTVTIDELAMRHIHPYLWGHVLSVYLTGFTPLNHYLTLTLKNQKGDEIATYDTLMEP